MKKNILVLLFLLGCSVSQAQIGIGVAKPDASSVLELKSSTKGFLPPRMTTDQRTAITSPATGLTIFNTTINCMEWYTGSGWKNACNDEQGGVSTIVSKTGKIWMDRNLGATRVATSATDYLAYGSLYQWGRNSDGHERINWTSSTTGTSVNGTTATKATSASPGHGNFILDSGNTNNGDWASVSLINQWQGGSGTDADVNDPCPLGFRIPTSVELKGEFDAYVVRDLTSGYNSPHRYVAAGIRGRNGVLTSVNTNMYIWSSTSSVQSGTAWVALGMQQNGAYTGYNLRSQGLSVRCIKINSYY